MTQKMPLRCRDLTAQRTNKRGQIGGLGCDWRCMSPISLRMRKPDAAGRLSGGGNRHYRALWISAVDRNFRRAGMDYLQSADIRRHESWAQFYEATRPTSRLVLLTTRGYGLHRFCLHPRRYPACGRESAGVPQAVHDAMTRGLVIPLRAGLRSLNVAQAAAMVLGEALRQTSGFPVTGCPKIDCGTDPISARRTGCPGAPASRRSRSDSGARRPG